MLIALGVALFFYLCISLYSRNLGLYVLLLLLPAYVVRFSIGGYPSTWVEVMAVVTLVLFVVDCFLDALLRKRAVDFLRGHKLFVLCAGVFLLGATVSLFFSLDVPKAFDQWRAYYVWPLLLFAVFVARFQRHEDWEHAVGALVLSTAGVSVLAAYQEFTGWGIINPFWQAESTRRVTSIFGYPNGIGLYMSAVAPLIGGMLIYYIGRWCEELKKNTRMLLVARIAVYFFTLVLALCSVWWAHSMGAILAIAGAVFFAAMFDYRTRYVAVIFVIAGMLALVSAPPGNPYRQELLFQDLSGQIRLSMWRETLEFAKDHPVRGAGMVSYKQRMPPHHKMRVEIYQHPHNLVLNFWAETGLVGLVGFIGLVSMVAHKLITRRTFFAWVALAGLISIFIHGLVDVPIMRYDLAILFWFLVACGLVFDKKT